jgi:glutamate carboxypeptidase
VNGILTRAAELGEDMVAFLTTLAERESPTGVPESQGPVQRHLAEALTELGYRIRRVPGRESGGHLLAVPRRRRRGGATQLMLGHSDTVWPLGTLADMPVERVDGRLHGPGTFDMKGGLTQMIFALRILRDLDMVPEVTPIVFVNSDEEVGSPESRPHVGRLARTVCRALVLEPSLGPEGRLKTARKGVGEFQVTLKGRAAHAGLDPSAGASAIEELAHLVQRLHALTDLERGTTVNVGVVSGGTRANVVAAEARAQVDVRVLSAEDGRRVEEAVFGLEARTAGVSIEVAGGIRALPLERTPRNRRLWEQARSVGRELGLDLLEVTAGGGSDGNTTSLFTATLDGLGPVGDGAHARHEHVEIAGLVERTALVAGLLMAPDGSPTDAPEAGPGG